MIGTIQDNTERMRSRQELQDLNETLEQRVLECTRELAKRSRGQFLANMRHEIRTPLHAVMGMLYLARKASPNPSLRKHLEEIQQSSGHLLAIINDILDFSKIDAGKLNLEIAACALQPVLQQVLALVDDKAREKGLALRLEQILGSFLNNACKFTDHGEVVLRVSAANVGLANGLCELPMEVQDTGVGVVSTPGLGSCFWFGGQFEVAQSPA
jgi:two-component system sensor histidine kinase/response regulator